MSLFIVRTLGGEVALVGFLAGGVAFGGPSLSSGLRKITRGDPKARLAARLEMYPVSDELLPVSLTRTSVGG